MDKGTKRLGFVYKLEQHTVVRAVRGGLVSLIPVLIIGAFSLILQTFPVTVYQKAISSFVVCYSVSYLAMSSGLVPLITETVEWTTPIILGGLRTTGRYKARGGRRFPSRSGRNS